MIRGSLQRNRPVVVLLALLLVGLAASTAIYWTLQIRDPKPPSAEDVLTDRHKEMVKAHGELSKWLLGIASATLAGLVSLIFKEPAREDLRDSLSMATYAFLLLSYYGAFLYFQATTQILRIGPLNYFYADQFVFPILLQFWSLIAALVLLAIWILRRKAVSLVATSVLLGLLVSGGPATAQTVAVGDCAASWFQSRFGERRGGQESASVLDRVQKRAQGQRIASCTDAESLLDGLRLASVTAGNPDTAAAFGAYLAGVDRELKALGLGSNSVLDMLLEIMAPWNRPLGTLHVKAQRGTCEILLNGKLVGLTEWNRRLEPGVYRLRVVRGGRPIYSSDALEIAAGGTRLINPDK